MSHATARRCTALLALAGVALLLPAAAAAGIAHGQGVLWRITGADGAEPSYLFGTIHTDDPRVLDLDPAVDQAFADARRYAFELDFREDIRGPMTRAMFDREPPTLREQLAPAVWERARAAATQRGIPENMLAPMKPWALAVTLAVPAIDPSKALDRTLFDRAVQTGRPVTGLESVEEQIALFDDIPLADQVAMLRGVLELHAEDRLAPMFEDLTAAWLRGDLDEVMAISKANPMLPDSGRNEAFERRAVTVRNARMAERMQPLLARGDAFVAVGALHLPGEDGILRLLEAAGYTVARAH